jgi:hypothetical protein
MPVEWKDVWPFLVFAAVAIFALVLIYSVVTYVFSNFWILAIILVAAAAVLFAKYYPKS